VRVCVDYIQGMGTWGNSETVMPKTAPHGQNWSVVIDMEESHDPQQNKYSCS